MDARQLAESVRDGIGCPGGEHAIDGDKETRLDHRALRDLALEDAQSEEREHRERDGDDELGVVAVALHRLERHVAQQRHAAKAQKRDQRHQAALGRLLVARRRLQLQLLDLSNTHTAQYSNRGR